MREVVDRFRALAGDRGLAYVPEHALASNFFNAGKLARGEGEPSRRGRPNRTAAELAALREYDF